MGFGWEREKKKEILLAMVMANSGIGSPSFSFFFLIALVLDEEKKELSGICDAIQQNPTSRNAVFADVNVGRAAEE